MNLALFTLEFKSRNSLAFQFSYLSIISNRKGLQFASMASMEILVFKNANKWLPSSLRQINHSIINSNTTASPAAAAAAAGKGGGGGAGPAKELLHFILVHSRERTQRCHLSTHKRDLSAVTSCCCCCCCCWSSPSTTESSSSYKEAAAAIETYRQQNHYQQQQQQEQAASPSIPRRLY